MQQKVLWSEVRHEVAAVNPVLANIIDQIAPDETLRLELGTFAYGDEVISTTDQGLLPFLILQKTCEVFFEHKQQPIIHRLYAPGEIAFSESIFNHGAIAWQNPLWKITAGARNVFMAPKISASHQHNKLQEALDFEVNKPQHLKDHWHVFKLIANSAAYEQTWQCRVLFFNKAWFIHKNDCAWQGFYAYLSREANKKSVAASQQFIINLLLNMLQQEKPIKLSSPQIEQISHLFMLGLSITPGFAPTHDELLLPTKSIQKAYMEHYGLDKYLPIIMAPKYLKDLNKKSNAIYTSFKRPAFQHFAPMVNTAKSTAHEVQQFIWALNKLLDYIKAKKLIYVDNPLYQFLNNYELNFYHQSAQHYAEFSALPLIAKTDKSFIQSHKNNRFKFPEKVSFFNGCVQIKSKLP